MADDNDIDRALEIFQEFGRERAIPVMKRWRDAFPAATDGQFREWEDTFRELEEYAYWLGDQVMRGNFSDAEAAAMIARRFPMLSRERVNRTLSQGIYFSTK